MLRLKPVLQIQGEKLDAFAKARTTNQGKAIMLTAIRNDMDTLPIYIPGRFRTASSPSSTVMLEAS